jgi:hypothetical protein
MAVVVSYADNAERVSVFRDGVRSGEQRDEPKRCLWPSSPLKGARVRRQATPPARLPDADCRSQYGAARASYSLPLSRVRESDGHAGAIAFHVVRARRLGARYRRGFLSPRYPPRAAASREDKWP